MQCSAVQCTICFLPLLPNLFPLPSWYYTIPCLSACPPARLPACLPARLQVMPLVVQALPMQSQRVTYIRAFLWAMPERCQQVGTT